MNPARADPNPISLRTAIENALLKTGYTPEQAAKYLGNAQLLVTVLSIGTGGFIAAKGPAGTVRVTGTTVVDELAGPPTAAQLAAAKSYGIDPKWVLANGELRWPEMDGFDGPPKIVDLKPGVKFDRYGGRMEDGNFKDDGFTAAALGDSFESRSLPPSYGDRYFRRYEVLKPIPEVKSGRSTPWFDQPGGCTQYKFSKNIDQLIDQGYIRKLD